MRFQSRVLTRLLSIFAASAFLAISSPASAALILLSAFNGEWLNPTGNPTNYSTTGSPGNNPQAHWGVDLGSGQSGYTLDLAPPPAVPLSFTVPPSTLPFYIGQFMHVNNPIGPNSITGIDLRISMDISVDGQDQGIKTFGFHFTHDETTNDLNPCPYGGANGQGLNINGCADAVTVSFLTSSDTFVVNGVAYTLNLLGFAPGVDRSCAGNTSNQFLTVEDANNPASLCAAIVTRSSLAPEPGTLALLALGLISLTFVRRRLA
jgi:hypothetical protein